MRHVGCLAPLVSPCASSLSPASCIAIPSQRLLHASRLVKNSSQASTSSSPSSCPVGMASTSAPQNTNKQCLAPTCEAHAKSPSGFRSMLPGFVQNFLHERELRTIHHNIGVRAAESALEQAQLEVFYNSFGLPQKLRSHVCLLAVHLWLADMGFRQGGTVYKRKHEGLFEAFWKHLEILIYQNGEHALLVKKRLKEVQQHTFGTLVTFSRAYEVRELGNPKPMLGAIYRNVYDGADGLDLRHLYQMDMYMHECRQNFTKHLNDTDNGILHWATPSNKFPYVSKQELASLNVQELSVPLIGADERVRTWRL
eukprot:g16521.t1